MDPIQRQMLGVAYKELDNAGIPLEGIDGQPVACYVASYSSGRLMGLDYGNMQNRDAEDRPDNHGVATSLRSVARSILPF
ncbi:Acyl transferase/acyl hydrolase/lysophospholipase [Penicillium cf. griseofulvum]|nr:Acyl transferase/acyl hydrolase/lysophospholipase [Penicillium cf. griseofulvum]